MTICEWLPEPAGIVILTALGLEYQAVREHLVGPEVRVHPRHTVFEVGGITGTGWQVALAETGVGNRSAAVVTDRAVDMFRPAAIFFVGVAGGLMAGIELGDVVVGTRIYDYQGGLDTDDGFLGRPQSWDAPYDLDQVARHVARTGRWTDLLGTGQRAGQRGAGRRSGQRGAGQRGRIPTVHFKPIAAGAVVLGSRTTAIAEQLRRSFNDAAAIEMESAGAAYAAHLNRTRILTVRGISDHADRHKHAVDRAGSQPRAARNAAAFTMALISALARPVVR